MSSSESAFITELLVAALLFLHGFTLIFSLRQTACCLTASVASFLFFMGSLLLASILGDFRGGGGIGAAVGILLLLMALTPFAFITAWVAAWRLLPKQLPFSPRPTLRRAIGGIFILAAFLLAISLKFS